MKSIITLLAIIIVFSSTNVLYSQSSDAELGSSSINSALISLNNRTSFKEVKRKKQLVGNYYLFEEYALADIYLTEYDEVIENVEIKINLLYSVVEIKYKNEVKVLSALSFKKIVFKDLLKETIYSKSQIHPDGPAGFYSILYTNKTKLYCHYYTHVEPAHYNQVLETGSKDDVMTTKKAYYVTYNDELVKLEGKKKKLMEQFEDKPKVVNYIKEHKVNALKENDVIALVKYLDDNL